MIHPPRVCRGARLVVTGLNAQEPVPAPANQEASSIEFRSHVHPHFESHKHATTLDATRFITSRMSAIDLPLPEEKDAFVFSVFGDRTGGPAEGIEVLKQAVADVNLFEPDLVMTVGDLIEGYNETAAWLPQMREYKQVMGKLLCPWFPVAGNHDIYWRGKNKPPGDHEQNYEMHFGPLWYAFSHKNCWFSVLYSDEGDPSTGVKDFGNPSAQRMSPDQFDWLKATLQRARDAQHVFLFLHHPRWLGGGYGDDWQRVHRELVAAGNVRIVFAGHIHRMRYDGPRDGIEYITLATVGGGQSGVAPQAGYLHQYHLVTVRPQQIAMASIPVGEAMNVREITGQISDEVRTLAQTLPSFRQLAEIGDDGQPRRPMVVELFNPTSRPVEVVVRVDMSDGYWRANPDHVHCKVYPGQRITRTLQLSGRGPLNFNRFIGPHLIVDTDYLAPTSRIPIKEQRLNIPVRLDLVAPSRPPSNMAVSVNRTSYLAIDSGTLIIPDGPLTVECWLNARTFDTRVGLVAKTENSEFGLFAGGGVPNFSIHLDGRYVDVRSDQPMLEPGKWHHVAGVFDGKEVRLYVDGRVVARASASGKRRTNNLPLLVGADVDAAGLGVSHFDGLIDGVRVSTSVRYHGEAVDALFVGPPAAERAEATALLLNFDGAIGNWFYDESPNAAHAAKEGDTTLVAAE